MTLREKETFGFIRTFDLVFCFLQVICSAFQKSSQPLAVESFWHLPLMSHPTSDLSTIVINSFLFFNLAAGDVKQEFDNSHIVKSVKVRSFSWSVFSRIRTEYGEILRISSYSVRIRGNTDQKKLRIWTLLTQWFLGQVIIVTMNAPHRLLIQLHKFQLNFHLNFYKMMESEVYTWKYFHYNWINLMAMHVFPQ